MTIAQANKQIAKTGHQIVRETTGRFPGVVVRHISGGADQFYGSVQEVLFYFNRAHGA
jgi:hypothetical protein